MRHKYTIGQKVRVKISLPNVYTIGTIIGVPNQNDSYYNRAIIEAPNQNDSYYTVDLEGCLCYAEEQYILPYEDSAIIVNVRNLI